MTVSRKNKPPDFFDDNPVDPMQAATRWPRKAAPTPKKKAGFYISEPLLERFNRRFHQLKLDGVPIENKSTLVEIALTFALDDFEKGQKSVLLATLMKTA
jgi:hypothetical protein